MEQLVIEQRQKGQRLESELSAAQDRIGGSERRARWLEEENIKIKGELQSWNDYSNQEETSPAVLVSNPVSTPLSAPDGMSLFNFSTRMSMPANDFPFDIQASQILLGPSVMTSTPIVSQSMESSGWFELTSESIRQ